MSSAILFRDESTAKKFSLACGLYCLYIPSCFVWSKNYIDIIFRNLNGEVQMCFADDLFTAVSTHLPLDKMAAISQMIFLDVF